MEVVTFDLWGTLFADDLTRNVSTVKKRMNMTRMILGEHGFHFSYEEIEEAFFSFSKKVKIIRNKGFDIDTTEQTALLLSQLNITPPHDLIEEIEKSLSTIWLTTLPPLAPHAEEVLSFLSPLVKIGLISNTGWTSGKIVRIIFERLGILHYFSYLTFSNEVKLWKPNPQIFLRTTKALGVHPEDAMHVGDMLNADIRGAKCAGMKTAYLGKSEEADFCLADLGSIIKNWEKMMHL